MYCDSPAELSKNPEAMLWFERIANGDQSALAFLKTMWSVTHMYDDLVDKDGAVTTEQAAGELISLITVLCYNQFFLANRDSLVPLIISMGNRWVDGDEWATKEDPAERALAPAIRCGDVDLYLFVAFLTGGWEHMRRIKEARSYDPDTEV